MAKEAKRDKTEILVRTEKWPLLVDSEQEKLILKVSDALREYFNWAIESEKRANDVYQKALSAAPNIKPNEKRFLNEIDLYNLWKPVRSKDAKDSLFQGRVPANWVLETFKSTVGAYKSFFALVKNGDRDARPPRIRPAERFQAIPGCSAFSVRGNRVVLAPEIFGRETLAFPIPPTYQAKMLARSARVAKFIISRDETDLRRPGRFWISISYEIPKPEPKPFIPQQAVFIALGASSIGVVSPKGEETIKLWRSDKHWKPLIDRAEEHLKGKPFNTVRPGLTKGSRRWKKLRRAHGEMNLHMARQQTQNRREVVGIDLIEKTAENIVRGHGIHFVLTDIIVRSKEGKLADTSQKERGGALGLNWSAQNTGSIGYLAQWLEIKVAEYGGSVRKHKLPYKALPKGLSGGGHENKISLAHALRDDFLRSNMSIK